MRKELTKKKRIGNCILTEMRQRGSQKRNLTKGSVWQHWSSLRTMKWGTPLCCSVAGCLFNQHSWRMWHFRSLKFILSNANILKWEFFGNDTALCVVKLNRGVCGSHLFVGAPSNSGWRSASHLCSPCELSFTVTLSVPDRHPQHLVVCWLNYLKDWKPTNSNLGKA